MINADTFLRDALFGGAAFNPYTCCHRPIVITNDQTTLGNAIVRFKVSPERSDDDVIDEDIIVVWGQTKRVITGADILGKLLSGIVQKDNPPEKEPGT